MINQAKQATKKGTDTKKGDTWPAHWPTTCARKSTGGQKRNGRCKHPAQPLLPAYPPHLILADQILSVQIQEAAEAKAERKAVRKAEQKAQRKAQREAQREADLELA
jgi:hypothetical protein